jgi:L-Ala-D/L-Glu epimerase
MVEINYRVEHWRIAGTFTIARGAKTEAVVVVAEITDGDIVARGESVPYGRYDESIASVCAEMDAILPALRQTPTREALSQLLHAGAARNALDCALWDYEAKKSGKRVWELAQLPEPVPVQTAYTISLSDPDTMFAKASAESHRPLLKVKLGTPDDLPRLKAVRAGAPNAQIIVDANEGWTRADLEKLLPQLVDNGVCLIEQPLKAGADAELADLRSPIPLCADESAHQSGDIARLAAFYQAVNIKLDKTGGLTEALLMAQAARHASLDIMIGCMVGTSLSMAPALLLTGYARYVDLDGPLLLEKDRPEGLKYEGSLVHPPSKSLWG